MSLNRVTTHYVLHFYESGSFRVMLSVVFTSKVDILVVMGGFIAYIRMIVTLWNDACSVYTAFVTNCHH